MTIPPQPRVLIELQDALARGVADVRTLSHIIARDPVLRQRCSMSYKVPHSGVSAIYVVVPRTSGDWLAADREYPARHRHDLLPAGQAQSQGFPGLTGPRSLAIAELAMLVADERVTVCNISPIRRIWPGSFMIVGCRC